MNDLIPVAKSGEYLEVHPSCLAAHKEIGWRECERQAAVEVADPRRRQEGAKKAELQALLDAAA